MKRILVLATAVLLIVGLAGCPGEPAKKPTTPPAKTNGDKAGDKKMSEADKAKPEENIKLEGPAQTKPPVANSNVDLPPVNLDVDAVKKPDAAPTTENKTTENKTADTEEKKTE